MTLPDPAETFRQEARELVEQLEQNLLDLEHNPADSDLVNSTFRALHTIKGSGAMFGFTEVASFVHEFETAFDRVRKGETAPNAELVAVALDAKDHILQLIEGNSEPISGGDAILTALRRIVQPGTAAAPTPLADAEAPISAAGWHIRFRLPADALIFGANPFLLLEELAGLGRCEVRAELAEVPDLSMIDPEVCYLGWNVTLLTDQPLGAVEDVFMFLRDGMDLSIEPLAVEMAEAEPEPIPLEVAPVVPEIAVPTLAEPPPAPRAEASSNKDAKAATTEKPGSSLRVPAERLDALMDRVGELVIAQARLTQIAAMSSDANLKTIAEELERLSSGLRDTTMGIRMVPIGTLFGRFRRLVHDLSHDLGKDISFITSGEETELDKTMIERLADPLVHLIRNAVDHGLEDANKRVAAGKSAKGTVRLSAVYAGAEVAISVSDDGAGLNAERIRAKAEEAGLIAPDAKLSEQELFQLIFAPGFSTAKEVTALSGRGVGMDVVKRTIDGLRGGIDLSTVPGNGTTATLRLPLTLAIIDGMLVRVGNGRYTIPLSAVEECVELPADAAAASKGRSFLDIRGSLVPFLRLRELFNAQTPPDAHQKVVIVSSGEGRVGLVVDQIIGNNQTVIKQLSKLHTGIKSFSGATILGDGTVALILDTTHLVGFGQALEDRRKGEPIKTELNGRAA
ncbi:MAG: chemotaxis protein CheA [Hyphomicrobiales bacterium]|nr:chemotaxis protein CheA [Hyphomicrobiales bacterium]